MVFPPPFNMYLLGILNNHFDYLHLNFHIICDTFTLFFLFFFEEVQEKIKKLSVLENKGDLTIVIIVELLVIVQEYLRIVELIPYFLNLNQ